MAAKQKMFQQNNHCLVLETKKRENKGKQKFKDLSVFQIDNNQVLKFLTINPLLVDSNLPVRKHPVTTKTKNKKKTKEIKKKKTSGARHHPKSDTCVRDLISRLVICQKKKKKNKKRQERKGEAKEIQEESRLNVTQR